MHVLLKPFSDAVLSQQPSPKNFLQFFSRVFVQISMNLVESVVKISDKKFCKKFLGLGCCDKTASENDFRILLCVVKSYQIGFKFV